jgi:hypothetical protein
MNSSARVLPQLELDFDRELPAGVNFFTPRLLTFTWHCSKAHVQELIDTGALRTVIDLKSASATARLLRIPRASVCQFLDSRKASRSPLPAASERLDASELLPATSDFYPAWQIARRLCVTPNHIVNLIDEGSLTRAVALQAGSRAMWRIPHAELVRFLNARRLP